MVCTTPRRRAKVAIFSPNSLRLPRVALSKQPLSIMRQIAVVRRIASQKSSPPCTIKTQSLEECLQSRLPQQATSREKSRVRIARCHSAQSIQSNYVAGSCRQKSDSRIDCLLPQDEHFSSLKITTPPASLKLRLS